MTNPFERSGPRWYSIPAHRPFMEDLAEGLLEALPAPEDLAGAVVLIPTRRGGRTLAEAFVKVGRGRATLLPQIRALGDLEEGEPPFEPGDLALDLPAAIDPARKRLELAGIVAASAEAFGRDLDAAGALEMADALSTFLDAVQIEEIPALDRLDDLAGIDMARHWQISSRALKLSLEAWPRRLRELNLADVSERRVALMRALARRWETHPPTGPVVAAGATGSAPAADALLAAIAAAPRGCVVLPGLDLELAESAWDQVGEQHPQGAMKRLLQGAGVTRDQVGDWRADVDSRGRWRRRLINEALRPAEATADWLKQIQALRDQAGADVGDPVAEGLKGLTLITARTEEEAAAICALLLREALETDGKTAALITPDLDLSRRVSARLTRWGVEADSSAGSPLSESPAGVLTDLVARLAAQPDDPVLRLAVLKHPLVRMGMELPALDRARTWLERYALRGARPRGPEETRRRLDRAAEARDAQPVSPDRLAGLAEAQVLSESLDTSLAEARFETAAPADAARRLGLVLETLTRGETEGRLWAGPAGEALGGLLSGLIAYGAALPEVTPTGFARLLESLLASETVRAGGALHPRLKIMGALEARTGGAGRIVLAGLEEGVWPRAAPTDPFLSRPMRETLGLPSPERRIGLSAHDFAQAACAPEVVLVHSERRSGGPAVESRWLWRLRTLARGAEVTLPGRPDLVDWARRLDAPLDDPPPALRRASRPAPTPPVSERPRKLSVTRIETLVRDPYAIYAQQVLRLSPLDPPGALPESSVRGTAIHAAVERFAGQWESLNLTTGPAVFLDLYLEELDKAGSPAWSRAREGALGARSGGWLTAFEQRRRADGARVRVEQGGQISFAAPGGDFTLTARADRIETTGDQTRIIDFKTGAVPSKDQIVFGFSPQLTLTAAMIARGGFPGLPTDVTEHLYVRLTGREPPGAEEDQGGVGDEARDRADRAWDGLRRLIERYDDPKQAYASRTAPQFARARGDDYDHLARVREWSTAAEEEGE